MSSWFLNPESSSSHGNPGRRQHLSQIGVTSLMASAWTPTWSTSAAAALTSGERWEEGFMQTFLFMYLFFCECRSSPATVAASLRLLHSSRPRNAWSSAAQPQLVVSWITMVFFFLKLSVVAQGNWEEWVSDVCQCTMKYLAFTSKMMLFCSAACTE